MKAERGLWAIFSRIGRAPTVGQNKDLPLIDATVSAEMMQKLANTASEARARLHEKSDVYLSIPLDNLEAAIDTTPIPDPWVEGEERIRQFAQDVIGLHRANAGNQSEVFLGPVGSFAARNYFNMGLGIHNNYGHGDPRLMNSQPGLVMEFSVQRSFGKWNAMMTLHERFGEKNVALNDRFAALSPIEQIGVAWLFTEAARDVAERSPMPHPVEEGV